MPRWRLSVHLLPWESKASDSFGPEKTRKIVWGLEVSKQMSHTPILGLGLGWRSLSPLGGGNVTALQHERRGRFRVAGWVLLSRAPAGPGTAGQLQESLRPRAPPGYTARRTVCIAPAAPKPPGRWLGVPGPARAAAAVTGVFGARSGHRRGRQPLPNPASRAPGGRPRDRGGDPASQAGKDQTRGNPQRLRGSLSAGSWSPGTRSPGCRSAL